MTQNQNNVFENGEADKYFARNAGTHDGREAYDICLKYVKKCAPTPHTEICELGACDGWRLNLIRQQFASQVFGVELSAKACEAARAKDLELLCEDVCFFDHKRQFDIVLVPYVFHWIDRNLLLQAVANIDRHIKPGGYLIIEDFYQDDFKKVKFHHTDEELWTYKQNYGALFTHSGSYQLLEKDIYSYEALQKGSMDIQKPLSEADQSAIMLLQKSDSLYEEQKI